MPTFLPPKTGQSLAIFVCARCKMKRYYADMVTDPNNGLKVCNQGCADEYDPWRLPARRTETISLKFPRPDEDIST